MILFNLMVFLYRAETPARVDLIQSKPSHSGIKTAGSSGAPGGPASSIKNRYGLSGVTPKGLKSKLLNRLQGNSRQYFDSGDYNGDQSKARRPSAPKLVPGESTNIRFSTHFFNFSALTVMILQGLE